MELPVHFSPIYWGGSMTATYCNHGIAELMDMKIEKKSFLKSLRFGRKVPRIKMCTCRECKCPLCAEKVNEDEFRNEVFIKEFKSSGLCQECQDTVFGYKVAW
jgi:hypothetical protein